MVKNAVEASDDEPVTIEVLSELNDIIFKVHNCQYISRDIQLQIFKRSFSTKEKGQGIGTYSMKLLGEKYLAGEVSFSTEKRLGTTFTFRLSNVKRNDIFADNGNK